MDNEQVHAGKKEYDENFYQRYKDGSYMTLEVAEHLSPARADSFVEDLTKLSDVILFSAAIPAQGGTNHVNEQWQSYWAQKFSRLGYVAIDCIRPKVWEDTALDIHYRQNIFMYVKSSELYRYPELQEFYLKHRDAIIFDAVHPQMWISRLLVFQNAYANLQKQLAADKRSGGGAENYKIFLPPLINPYTQKNFPTRQRAGIFLSAKIY